MKQPEAFKQPEMLYTHLLIENAINNGYEPRTHLGCDEMSIVERAYDEGETSKQIFTWHSDEKFKRLHEANQAMLVALKKRAEVDRAYIELSVMDLDTDTHEKMLQEIEDAEDSAKEITRAAIAKAETNEGTA